MSGVPARRPRELRFSLMFFACTESASDGGRYRLVIESARFADREGFASVWVPERHFTEFGYLYPNPAVLHAALARETTQVRLMAGSVVAPLHDPIRIAEEWAMVDNLSGGRVGVSFASGWNPSDFAFFPERYPRRHDYLFETVPVVQRLWRGEPLESTTGTGERMQVRIQPPPVQRELPVWITAAGNPKTFARAGEIGANVLSHLLDHGVDEIGERIDVYRRARAAAGHDPDEGEVTVMVHTFVGEDADEVRELVRGPYCTWLKSNASLLKGLAANRGGQIDMSALSEADRDHFANHLFERFFESRSLMGTPESCVNLVNRLQEVGVTEVACLLDFGPGDDLVLQHLPHLARLRDVYRDQAVASGETGAAAAIEVAPLESSPDDVRSRCEEVDVDEFYEMLCRFGAQLESRFRGVQRLWRGEGEALGFVRLPEGIEAAGEGLHPVLLDSCFQVFAATLPARLTEESDALFLPGGFKRFEWRGSPATQVWSHATLASGDSGDRFEGSLRLLDDSGRVLAVCSGFRLVRTAQPARSASADPASWLYDVTWVRTDREPVAASGSKERWLILSDETGVGESVQRALTATGAECLMAYLRGGRTAGGTDVELDPDDAGGIRSTIARAAGERPNGLTGIVHAWSLDASLDEQLSTRALAAQERLIAGSTLAVAQAVASLPAGAAAPRLWFVTRGAQSVDDEVRPVAPMHALVWGFAKSFAAEHAERWGGLIDLDPAETAVDAGGRVGSTLRGGVKEDEIAWRGGVPFVPRLSRRAGTLDGAPAFGSDGTYLITGGAGGIGLKLADWLVSNGARHLLLIGRRTVPPRTAWEGVTRGTPAGRLVAAVRALEARGCRVTYASADVADDDQLAAALALPDLPPVRGVFHAAGLGRGQTLAELTPTELFEVLRAKVSGSWALHRRFSDPGLQCFVMFSSATHQIGLLRQGTAAYGAANAFLDALAHYRRRLGLPALSIDWGPWAQVGMAAQTANLARLQAFGVDGVTPREGTRIIGHLLQTGATQAWAIPVDWTQLLQADSSVAAMPFFSALVAGSGAARPSEEERARQRELRDGLSGLTHQGRVRRMQSLVMDEIRAIMRLDSTDDVDWRRGLFEIGMDSLMALELKNRLQVLVGTSIPSTLAFDHPTVELISGFLVRQMFAEGDASAAAPTGSDVDEQVAAAADAIRDLDDDALEQLLDEKLRTS